VRFGDWKAVKNGPNAKLELYDLKADPGESHDLSADKPDEAAKAAQLMASSRTEDPNWPLANGRVGKGKAKGKGKTKAGQ
jgi:arylsulfatase A-like enzyme